MSYIPSYDRLQASSVDILNAIRNSASVQYRDAIPAITDPKSIPKVGETLFGYPALVNEFTGILMSRIARVDIKTAVFYNPYRRFKKGFIEFGELVEEIFVNIAKVYAWDSQEPVEKRELGREPSDIKTAWHAMNWRVFYKCSVSEQRLRTAFLSAGGVNDLIAKIVDSVYTAASYDEWLLFKYLLIKGVTSGDIKTVTLADATVSTALKAFRGTSNNLTFMAREYNRAHVLNTTPRDRQVIFMDSAYNAEIDVDNLASAFNMDKATFFGQLELMDSFTTFDNERWAEIRNNPDNLTEQIEEVTAEELNQMKNVKAIIADTEFFQIYDNLEQMTEAYVGSRLFWNYFYHVWKTVDTSPFHNAVAFATTVVTDPAEVTFEVASKSVGDNATVLNLVPSSSVNLNGSLPQFVQTEDATTKGIGVHPIGAFLFPNNATKTTPEVVINGVTYKASEAMQTTATVGATITLSKVTA